MRCKLRWRCDICTGEGSLGHRQHASLWEVSQRVIDAHRAQAPECAGGSATIRVWPGLPKNLEKLLGE